MVALYVGGMGAKGKNFYNDLACRYGYEDVAARDPGPVPRRQQGRGHRARARRARRRREPSSGPRSGSPIGSRSGRTAAVTTMIVAATQPEALQLMAELVL